MNKKKLLKKGYLPKELPPPFNSGSLSEKHMHISKAWEIIKTGAKTPIGAESRKAANRRFKSTFDSEFRSSKCCRFTIPKGNYTRRKIEVPNPLHFSELCDTLLTSWKYIKSSNCYSHYIVSRTMSINKD